ncbi:MAG TPA: hypothetical protein PK951_10960, partial [Chitinophagaceae bacterium]|nr:hypothetical protein [Chitinophagaceae bacterium]
MKGITKAQISAIYGLLRKNGLSDDKARVVQQISNGRTDSVSKLHFNEALEWISAMNKGQAEQHKPEQRMINHIIAMAREMGVIQRMHVVRPNGA